MQDSSKRKKKKIIDLRRFLDAQELFPDENGSYTGITTDGFGNPTDEKPVQDVDDL